MWEQFIHSKRLEMVFFLFTDGNFSEYELKFWGVT